MSEQIEKAVRDYDEAAKQIRAQVTGKPGNANEVRYGEAYQRLVRLGQAPQLKRKYSQAKRFSK